MKKFNLAIPGILIVILFCFTQCKKENIEGKENTPYIPLNITLYNKPLAVIQSHIQGIWRLEYAKGGIANVTQYLHDQNRIWQFGVEDHIVQNDNGYIYTDTTIIWVRRPYGVTDSTFIMKVYEKSGFYSNYFVDGIINDSLVLHLDNVSHAPFYHFSKSK